MDIELGVDPAVIEQHARKTIIFDGSDPGGADTPFDIFTITGRVLVTKIIGFCTAGLTEGGATATISIGDTTDVDGFFVVDNAVDIDTNEWFGATLSSSNVQISAGVGQVTVPTMKAISANIIGTLGGSQTIATGTIIFDVWYQAITDGGNLAPA